MMKYYAAIADNTILAIGRSKLCKPETEITETEYNNILSIIHNKPADPEGYSYKLRADNLEWELVKLSNPEPIDEEASPEDYELALQQMGVDFSD